MALPERKRRNAAAWAEPTQPPRSASQANALEHELLDPTAVQQAYRRERARRRAREDRKRERMLAGFRFWLAVAAVIATSVTLAVLIWHEIHHLFGL
jgi:hypothetical protein